VRPVLVVVGYVAGQRRLQMPLTDDQHPIQQLTTDRADPSRRDRDRAWRPHERWQAPDAFRSEDHLERRGQLRIPVA